MVVSSWLAIAKVHPVNLINADWSVGSRPGPDRQPIWIIISPPERQLLSAFTIAVYIYYYYYYYYYSVRN